ncbi:zinc transport system substrate-binding protein [Nicoletella semolina]|uniref:High-affinity zinc uptake system protein ZnuA n=1 Tax=Nicoletella semolina TaxID=271160 RepID=A0A4R2N4E7_9PAST|nr:zinc ABC transporter substrate-binding protein ZnuA [Nicoletella semolina]MDH2925098.1 zinc ABC transporter substrate-binding protein [Nicoletella semolina]TCP15385.1 zinc transport system substrate-binding protein [Nicoletella semolina]
MLRKSTISLALLSVIATAQANVLTTVKPLGFIASAITDGVTQTEVLLPVSASPHDYSLKPSDIQKLNSAELVVWIGEEMETFLEKSIDKLPKEKVLTLEDVPAIEELVEHAEEQAELKEKKHAHHEHKHSHEHSHDHHHDENWHIWLSPQASEIIAEQIAARLSQQLPHQKAKIAENLATFKANLNAKNAEIAQQLQPAQGKGYYTFHDAYGYFEKSYNLTSLGSFTINPSIAPGAKTLQKIKKDVEKNAAKCLFTEPQFTPKVVESLSKNTGINVSQLDPLGAKIELSSTAYPEFLQSLADSFGQCLTQ